MTLPLMSLRWTTVASLPCLCLTPDVAFGVPGCERAKAVDVGVEAGVGGGLADSALPRRSELSEREGFNRALICSILAFEGADPGSGVTSSSPSTTDGEGDNTWRAGQT